MELNGSNFLKAILQQGGNQSFYCKVKNVWKDHYFRLYYNSIFPYSLVKWIWHLVFNCKVQVFSSEGNAFKCI